MKARHTLLLNIARELLTLVQQESEPRRLQMLADLTLALKPLLDQLPDYPDLGLELHEYSLLKPDHSRVAEKFRKSLAETLGN